MPARSEVYLHGHHDSVLRSHRWRTAENSWCYTGPADRAWWGQSWAERLIKSPFGDRATEQGLASRQDLERLARAWLRWSASQDGWLTSRSTSIITVSFLGPRAGSGTRPRRGGVLPRA